MSENYRIVTIHTRWPAEVDSLRPTEVNVKIPTGVNGTAILNPAFVEHFKLSKDEREAAEYAALKELVILPSK